MPKNEPFYTVTEMSLTRLSRTNCNLMYENKLQQLLVTTTSHITETVPLSKLWIGDYCSFFCYTIYKLDVQIKLHL